MTIKSKFPGTCNKCNCRFAAGEDILWSKNVIGASHATVAACAEAMRQKAASGAVQTSIDLTSIVKFIQAARDRGLKFPKLRVLDPTGKVEIQMGLTVKGLAPGSLWLKVHTPFGMNYYGSVRPTGSITGALATDPTMQKHLTYVAENPAAAAKEYAALMCQCSFCGLQLTDAGSVEVGYGPVCAKHWNLPHSPRGTPQLSPVPAL